MFKKFFKKVPALFTLVTLSILLCTGCFTYSNGERTGVLTKFSERGYFCKTWEGTMTLGAEGASGGLRNVWEFSVEDDEVAEELKKHMRTGKLVTLYYEQELWVAFWRGATKYIVTNIVKDLPNS